MAGDLAPLLSAGEIYGMLTPFLGFLVQDRQGHTGVSLAKDQNDDYGLEKSVT